MPSVFVLIYVGASVWVGGCSIIVLHGCANEFNEFRFRNEAFTLSVHDKLYFIIIISSHPWGYPHTGQCNHNNNVIQEQRNINIIIIMGWLSRAIVQSVAMINWIFRPLVVVGGCVCGVVVLN